ncbi:MAG: hypothetical protein LM550_07160 [Candidatus Contendobacter sp.]|nr:hypothetical protein [Gammaproteobacteria bacterium]MCC8993457.1 hypothetical protein [Candidatus Contendobacter sp.]
MRSLFVNPRLDDVQALAPCHSGALLLYQGILNIAHANEQCRFLQGYIVQGLAVNVTPGISSAVIGSPSG